MHNKYNNGYKIFAIVIILVTITFTFCGCGGNVTQASDVKSDEDFSHSTIAVQLGTTGDIYVSDYKDKGAQVVEFNKGADAIQALKESKADCVVIDEQPAKKFVAQNSDLSILDEPLTEEEYAICFAKGNDELKDKVDTALNTITENGTMDKIKDSYLNQEDSSEKYVKNDNLDRHNGTLTIATNATFEPYEFISNGEVVGIDIDMAQAIADTLNMDLKIENIEFDSIITSVSAGKADMGISGITVTDERKENVEFSQPYTTAKQVIIVRNGSSADTGIFSLNKIKTDFIDEGRWQYITNGLWTTLVITFFAVIIGIILGFLIAISRFSCDKTNKCKVLNAILKVYLTIIRGTPTMIQLLIIYYIIFASYNVNKIVVAIVAFGLNSSAYIAEIVRSGLSSIDEGQFEAGRSLGFTYVQTMKSFILPQAIKNILPALGNEFIVLLKETSISGYIGIMDLTRGGDFIRSRTYDAFLPLIVVALVYLGIVMLLSWLLGKLEKRLKKNEK